MSIDVATEKVHEEPRWFGPADRPLFGWLAWCRDVPSRGGVLLAPPIGREARAARRAMRAASLVLAAQGFVALRFDYEGTGDSSGAFDDPDRDGAWTASVAEAASFLRSLGATRISAIGMRLGATILGSAADRHDLDLDDLVLWDPCETGRSYLRQLSALESLRRDQVDAPEGTVETAEYVFGPAAAEEVRRLRLTTIARTPIARRVLVVTRADRSVSAALKERLAGELVTWTTTAEQPDLLDVDPLVAALPTGTIDEIAQWLTAVPAASAANDVAEGAPAAVVAHTPSGGVRERCVQLGPSHLFGIVTEPAGPPTGPLMVLLNVATDEHTGPSRLWVELSRRWAAHGLRSLRFDLSGVGDSPSSEETAAHGMYAPRWLDDIPDVVRALSPDDPSDAVLVGLCSGAYLAVEGGRAVAARGACVINPPVGMDFLAGTSRLQRSRHGAVRALGRQLLEVALRLRWLSVALWHVLRFVLPRTYNVDVMASLVDQGTDLFVLASTEDLSPYPSRRRLDRFFSRRLVTPANYEVTFVPGLDHSMLAAAGRARTIALLDAHVLERYAGVSAAPADDPDKEPG